MKALSFGEFVYCPGPRSEEVEWGDTCGRTAGAHPPVTKTPCSGCTLESADKLFFKNTHSWNPPPEILI